MRELFGPGGLCHRQVLHLSHFPPSRCSRLRPKKNERGEMDERHGLAVVAVEEESPFGAIVEQSL
jgi:hypothetical protein